VHFEAGFGASCGVYAIEVACAIVFGNPLINVSEANMEGNGAHIINAAKRDLKIILSFFYSRASRRASSN
jgi:hypothetical protein